MKTVDYDRLATAAPISKDAALARDGHGEQPLTRTAGGPVLVGPPKMQAKANVLPDFTGQRFGSLVMLGIKARDGDDGTWRANVWVCRCDCGNYTVRRHSKLVSGSASDLQLACPECAYQRRMLRNATLKAKGEKVLPAAPSRWTEIPPLKPVPAEAPALVGRVVGRLTVMGLCDKSAAGITAPDGRWVVRCECGVYEVRSAKFLTQTRWPDQAACSKCTDSSPQRAP